MNTNDLRFIKTEKILKEAYLTLKSKRQPFTLTQLCQEALINKTTFYKHYESLEEFEQKTQKEIMRNIYLECEHIDDSFKNTELFIKEIQKHTQDHKELMDTIFYPDINRCISISEEVLLELQLKDSYTLEEELKIRFCVLGSSYILIKDNSEETYQIINKLLKKVMEA